MSQDNIKSFINEHLVKVFYGIIIYFLMNLSGDFKDMKNTLQQLVINQATIETRLVRLEKSDEKQDTKLEKIYEIQTIKK